MYGCSGFAGLAGADEQADAREARLLTQQGRDRGYSRLSAAFMHLHTKYTHRTS